MAIVRNERIPCKLFFNTDLETERHGSYLIKSNGRIELEIFGFVRDRLGQRDLCGGGQIPEFSFVRGYDTRGNAFQICSRFESLFIGSNGSNFKYSNFRYGAFWRNSAEIKKQYGFDKIHLRIDHLSTFFSDLGKIKLMSVFKPSSQNLDFYQITADRVKDELYKFRLADYQITVKSYVTGLGYGNFKLLGDSVTLNVKELYYIEIKRDKNGGGIEIKDIEELQFFFQRFFSFTFQTQCYIKEVAGYIDDQEFSIINQIPDGECGKYEPIKCLFGIKTISRFEFKLDCWWQNRNRFSVLFGYTLSNMMKDDKGFENVISNYFQAIENYLNEVIKIPLYEKFLKENKFGFNPDGSTKVLKIADNRPTWFEKFSHLITESQYLSQVLQVTEDELKFLLKLKKALLHGDSNDQNQLINQAMFNLNFKLEKIAKYCFLKAIGFSEIEILKVLRY